MTVKSPHSGLVRGWVCRERKVSCEEKRLTEWRKGM